MLLRSSIVRIQTVFVFVIALVILTGCKEPLNTGLMENEANEILALLHRTGIQAERERDKEGNYSILVSKNNLPFAAEILIENGLPRKRYSSIGEIFQPQGIVSTPFEQRARFIHAMNEELSETIATIDGVVSARVHIMLPEVDRFDRVSEGARASIVIYQEADVDLTPQASEIKAIVVHSVQSLNYDDVQLAMFEMSPIERIGTAPTEGITQSLISPNRLAVSGAPSLLLYLFLFTIGLGFLMLLRSGLALFFGFVFQKTAKK